MSRSDSMAILFFIFHFLTEAKRAAPPKSTHKRNHPLNICHKERSSPLYVHAF